MDTQFHTPSLGDDILDLTDCEPQGESGTSTTSASNFNSMMPPQINVQFPMPMPDYPMNQMPTQRILRRRNSVRNSVDYNHYNMETPSEPTTFIPPLSLGARKQIPPLDGTESKGPISPYGHFFRDTACVIKQQNPNCSYQELTRIVLSMWSTLDANKKNRYQKKSEQSQGEYFKVDNQRLQQQHTNIGTSQAVQQPDVVQINNLNESNVMNHKVTGKSTVINMPQTTSQETPEERMLLETNIFDGFEMPCGDTLKETATVDLTVLPDSGEQQQQQQQNQQKLRTVEQEIFGSGDDQYSNLQTHSLMYDDRNIIDSETDALTATDTTAKTNTEQMLTEASSVRKCTRGNCNKRAIINPDWEDEYCSNECVVLHCRNVFEIWKSNLAQS